jgi:anti-sigma regulatory factor (Ser/Thr protein kinase)
MDKKLLIEIPIAWEYVREVRQHVHDALAGYPEELRSSSVMVASELVENAIKYGVAVPSLKWTRFCFECKPSLIRIEVSNGVTEASTAEAVKRRLAATPDREAGERLYLARLQQLVENPQPPNQLGLYRICAEGQFQLDCEYADQVLTIIARREMQ